MASGTADLQRDLGGAIMQSILGALLTAGYAAAVAGTISKAHASITTNVTSELERSFASASVVAQSYPASKTQIVEGAKASFLQGANWAYSAGAFAIVIGAVLVFAMFPKKDGEASLLATYAAQDAPAAP
jgi:hypothetical protein